MKGDQSPLQTKLEATSNDHPSSDPYTSDKATGRVTYSTDPSGEKQMTCQGAS